MLPLLLLPVYAVPLASPRRWVGRVSLVGTSSRGPALDKVQDWFLQDWSQVRCFVVLSVLSEAERKA